MTFFCAPALKKIAERRASRKACDGAPMLIQGVGLGDPAPLRPVDARRTGIRPHLIAEFDDSALMTAFGREGRGIFMAPAVLERETCAQYGVQVLGRTDDLVEEFYAISVERRITHPGVEAITQAARGRLFSA